jgi:hypothetical protein
MLSSTVVPLNEGAEVLGHPRLLRGSAPRVLRTTVKSVRAGQQKLLHVLLHTRRHFQFWLGFCSAAYFFTDRATKANLRALTDLPLAGKRYVPLADL